MDRLALRWETASRYYAIYIHADLWGGLVMTRVWGGKGSRIGGQQSAPVESEQIEQVLAEIARRRRQHRYQPADAATADLITRLANKGM